MASTNGKVPLSRLGVAVIPVDLVSPLGVKTRLHMRTIKGSDVQALQVTQPEPPVSNIGRNPVTGKVEPEYNYSDPSYHRALDDARIRLAVLGVILTIEDLEIPEGTDEERIAAVREGVAYWALDQLVAHFNRINGFSDKAMEEAAAELTPFSEESTPSSPALVGP